MQHLPSFAAATGWLNTAPLDAKELRDRVVLVNFWTLTCINWLRTEPYVRAWSRAYRDDGLVVVGVHTPEFGFEHNAELVLRSVADREIDYPVALDNDYGVWSAFSNHYWPALYFADREGVIRDQHFGEGRYEQSERTIQKLLDIDRDPVPVIGAGVEAEADWSHLRSPETYLGYGRSERFSSPDGFDFDEPRAYGLTKGLGLNEWTLDGRWTIGEECLILDRAPGIIAYRFHARDVHLVLDSDSPDPIGFRVRLDGEAPGASHGVDVGPDGIGSLTYGRMYQLIRTEPKVRERTVEIEFLQAGARAYVFTFG